MPHTSFKKGFLALAITGALGFSSLTHAAVSYTHLTLPTTPYV